jgi:hypothetical protein
MVEGRNSASSGELEKIPRPGTALTSRKEACLKSAANGHYNARRVIISIVEMEHTGIASDQEGDMRWRNLHM